MAYDQQKTMLQTAASPKAGALIRRLARDYLKPYWKRVAVAMAFMILGAAMTAGIAFLMQPVLDDVLVEKREGRILPVAFAVFSIFLLRGFATYAQTTLMIKVGQSIVGDIQKDLFNKFMKMDLAFFHSNPSGSLISRVVNDVSVMRIAVSETLTGLGRSAVTLIFLIAVMFYQDWKLSLIAFCIFPLASGFVVYLGKRLRKVSGHIQDEMASLSDILSQIFQGIRQVKAYGMEEYEIQRAGKAIDTVRELNVKSAQIGNLSTPVNEILVGLVLMGIISYGGYQALNDQMTAGQLASFLAAFIMAYEPMKRLAKLNNTLQTGLGASERVFTLMDREISIVEQPNAPALNAPTPEIVFKDVEFKYEESDAMALNKISFTASPGKVLALVGPSGGGKSTIINLIPRFYDVMAGSIYIDGQNLKDISVDSLRRHIALVSQDITIFDDTVLNNIRYSKPAASDDEVHNAARMAYAHDFIEAMPEGYSTMLGEDGVRLSGGQRQRIAIARAILRDAPILLLDEATSALDNESEQAVQKALETLEKGRTTIVIAHRLSTVQHADRIIVLDRGQIVEQGSHEELLNLNNGLYTRMYKVGLAA